MGHKMFLIYSFMESKQSHARSVKSFFSPISFLSSVSNHVQAFWSSHPNVVSFEVESSTLKRTRQPHNVVVFFFECMVWLMGSLRPMALSHVNEFNTFFKITLISCPPPPYSMSPSTLADRIWSLIHSFLFVQEKVCSLMVP